MANSGLIIVLGTLLIGAAAPVNAEVGVGNGQTKAPASAVASKEKKYCLKEALTGSRMSSQECKTKAEWAREGIDIDEVVKNK
jgi:hypothetical protein